MRLFLFVKNLLVTWKSLQNHYIDDDLFLFLFSMLSSSQVSILVSNDLDQNAYTSWHTGPKILNAISNAVNFILAYHKRPWSLVSAEQTVPSPTDQFTLDTEIFYPYWAYIDEKPLEHTAIPIVDFINKESCKFYVYDKVVKTSEAGIKFNMLYHRWHNKLTSIGDDDINLPDNMEQALIHVVLRYMYPSWLDLWASLSNQHFNMAKTILDTYKKAYWTLIQPKDIIPSRVYTS